MEIDLIAGGEGNELAVSAEAEFVDNNPCRLGVADGPARARGDIMNIKESLARLCSHSLHVRREKSDVRAIAAHNGCRGEDAGAALAAGQPTIGSSHPVSQINLRRRSRDDARGMICSRT